MVHRRDSHLSLNVLPAQLVSHALPLVSLHPQLLATLVLSAQVGPKAQNHGVHRKAEGCACLVSIVRQARRLQLRVLPASIARALLQMWLQGIVSQDTIAL